MAYNKIPLALAYDDNTGNASGLVEFTLGLSDAGDVCDTAPEQGQALVFSGTEWCPSTLPAPGEFTGNLSDVGQVCNAAPTNGQVLTWSGDAGEWCPSTVATGGGSPEIVYFEVQNDSGSDILVGQAVYISDHVGDNARVGLAQANDTATMPAIGIAHTTILNGTKGLITTLGEVQGGTYDGSPGPGSVLYISPATAGRVTSTKPTGGTELIQNVGVMIRSTNNPIIRATITARTNDIPNNLNVLGEVTVGNTVLSQTNAILSNVEQNSLMITNSASAVSSLSGASGTIPYFEGTTPAPGLKTFAQILTNENYNISPGATYATTTSLATTTAYAEGVSAAVAASAAQVALAYQPLDSDLTSIAGLTVAAGSIIYATGANTYAVLAAPLALSTLKFDPDGTGLPYWAGD